MSFGSSQGYDHVAGLPVLRANRETCVVCGHPTGDCVGEMPAPKHIWGLGDVPSLVDEQTVLVGQDIYEERQITQYSKVKVRIAKAGQKIPLHKARELGIVDK